MYARTPAFAREPIAGALVAMFVRMNPMRSDEVRALIPEWVLRSKSCSLAVTDLEGRYIFVNDVFERRFAFLADDFYGLPFDLTIHPDDVEKCNAAAYECMTNPQAVVEVQVRKPGKEGDFYWTNWEFSLFKDKDNQPAGLLCLGQDVTEAKRVEQQVKKSEAIIENITDGFYVLDREWRFVKMNSVAEHILGLKREKLLGKKLWDFFPDTPECKYPSQFRRAMDERITVGFEDYRPDIDRWFSSVAYPSAEGLTVFFRDVTRQKKTQERLKDSEGKLRAILDSTTDSNVLVSTDFRVLSFNTAANGIAGAISQKNLQEGCDFRDFLPDGSEEDFLHCFHKALAGEPSAIERMRLVGNEHVWFQVKYFPVREGGGIVGVSINTSNINERVNAENKLKQSEYMLSAIYNSTSEASTFIDRDFRILYNNKVAKAICRQIFGREPQNGDNSLDFMLPEMQAEFLEHYQKVLQGESVQVEKTDGKGWWLFSLFPVYDDNQKLVGIAHNVQDITERKESELKITAQNEALKEIAWQQSHEVRGRVASILGLVDLMRAEQADKLPYDEQYLAYLSQAACELDQVIRKIVVYTSG